MQAHDPIKDVSVVSTGSVVIRPEHVGPTRKNLYLWLFTSRRWTSPLPINAYVIEHDEGVVLFDTGQDRASVTDPDYFPGGFSGLVYSRLAKFDIGPRDTLTAGLQSLGHRPADVHTAVLSHLHQDHIGGLGELSGSRIVLSRAEWDAMTKPYPEARGFLPRHIDLPNLRWDRVDPEELADPRVAPFTHGHDVFADGSLVLLPTPGHTPGSVSLLVRRPGRLPLLMVGDLTYDDALLRDGALPGVGDKRGMREAARMVNELRVRLPGLVVLPAHDPAAAARLEAASGPATAVDRSIPGWGHEHAGGVDARVRAPTPRTARPAAAAGASAVEPRPADAAPADTAPVTGRDPTEERGRTP